MNEEDLRKARGEILTINNLLAVLKNASQFQEYWDIYELTCILEEKAKTLNAILTG